MTGPFQPLLIRVVDLETTGFPPDAEVIEIAAVDVQLAPFALPVIAGEGGIVLAPAPIMMQRLVRPGRLIPPESSAVHHIIDEDVAGALPWSEVWPLFTSPAIGAWCAHSAKFERAFLTDEMLDGRPWICTYKCALRLWPEAPSHSNQALRYWLDPPGLDRAKAMLAHRAYPDAYVTAHLLALLLERASVEQLLAWSAEPALLVRVPFGKAPPEGSRGLRWTEVDDGLLDWVRCRDFDEDVMFTVKAEIERRRKEREAAAPAFGVEVGEDDDDGEGDPW